MSLVSSEGEGEQNEIRILQDKLSATMKLVSHLTAQLSELKEQVRPLHPGLRWQPWLWPRSQPACLGAGRVVGPFCFLCPLPAGLPLGSGVEDGVPWRAGWRGDEAAPTPMLLKGRRAGLSATSRRWGLPRAPPHPHPAAARLWPRR